MKKVSQENSRLDLGGEQEAVAQRVPRPNRRLFFPFICTGCPMFNLHVTAYLPLFPLLGQSWRRQRRLVYFSIANLRLHLQALFYFLVEVYETISLQFVKLRTGFF